MNRIIAALAILALAASTAAIALVLSGHQSRYSLVSVTKREGPMSYPTLYRLDRRTGDLVRITGNEMRSVFDCSRSPTVAAMVVVERSQFDPNSAVPLSQGEKPPDPLASTKSKGASSGTNPFSALPEAKTISKHPSQSEVAYARYYEAHCQ